METLHFTHAWMFAPLELELKYSSSFPVETLPVLQVAAGFAEGSHSNQDGKIALGGVPLNLPQCWKTRLSPGWWLSMSLSPFTTRHLTCSQIPGKCLQLLTLKTFPTLMGSSSEDFSALCVFSTSELTSPSQCFCKRDGFGPNSVCFKLILC